MKVVIPVDSPESVEILVGLPDGRLLCVLIVDVIDNNVEAYVCVETSKWKGFNALYSRALNHRVRHGDHPTFR